MKKCLMVLTGILALVLFAPMASASFISCGSVGGPTGSTAFSTLSTVNGSASVTGSLATITCGAITVPTGFTLTSVSFKLFDDASTPYSTTASINFTWNNTTIPNYSTETVYLSSTDGLAFDTCSGASGPYVGGCPVILTATPNLTGSPTASYGPVTFTVSAAPGSAAVAGPPTSGGGVAANGGDSANLLMDYTLRNDSTPEPATFSLIGGALLGLGFLGRKKFIRP